MFWVPHPFHCKPMVHHTRDDEKWPMTPPTNDAETTKNIQKWSSEIQKFQGTSPFLTAPLAWQRAVARNFRRAVGSLARKRSCRRRNGCRACRTTSRRRVGDVRIGWNRTDGDIRKKKFLKIEKQWNTNKFTTNFHRSGAFWLRWHLWYILWDLFYGASLKVIWIWCILIHHRTWETCGIRSSPLEYTLVWCFPFSGPAPMHPASQLDDQSQSRFHYIPFNPIPIN